MVLKTENLKIGINENNIIELSRERNEPDWLLELRLKAFRKFKELEMPTWSPVFNIDYSQIKIGIKVMDKKAHSWDEVPEEIRTTIDKLGIVDAEKRFLMGSATQVEAEMIYKRIKEEIKNKGIIFESMDEAIKNHPELIKEYFGKLVSYADNKMAALNTACFTGGTFIYVPKNLKLDLPLQTFFLMNFEQSGQFERSLIIADENSEVHYIEGCTAPLYTRANLHAGVVEIFVKKNARIRFTTIQNWSKNVYNFSTKRAIVEENGHIEWIDGNLGSKLTMKYPMAILKDNASAEILSLSIVSDNQIIDAGAKILFQGKNCRASVLSKSIVMENANSTFRSLCKIPREASGTINIDCDSLILSETAESHAFPTHINNSPNAIIKHEAKVSYLDEAQLFYLKSKGIDEKKAKSLLILGFINPIAKTLPLEYAIELNKLIEMAFENERH
ncbi:MAG: Fe-S cluster assembly protein SufB [Candidatus Woesearchaeota archaeon]